MAFTPPGAFTTASSSEWPEACMSIVMSPYHQPSKSWLPVQRSGTVSAPLNTRCQASRTCSHELTVPQSAMSPHTITASAPRSLNSRSAFS